MRACTGDSPEVEVTSTQKESRIKRLCKSVSDGIISKALKDNVLKNRVIRDVWMKNSRMVS